ncbi:hypothetical protein Sgri01_06073 [Streptomyces griseus]
MHGVPVAHRVRQPLQHQHPGALAPARTVSVGAERLAAPVLGQAALAAELHEHVRVRHDRRTTGQRQRDLTGTQRLRREVRRRDGRGARRVDRHGRTLQAQRVGDATGGDRRGRTRADEPLHRGGVLADARCVVVVHQPGVDTGPRAAQGGRRDARALQRVPGGLQQQPVLRVHRRRLAGRDPEELGVERVGLVKESAVLHVRGAGALGVRVVQVGPAAVGRELADRVDPVGDQPPQVLGRCHTAGEPAGHAHHGDRVVGHRRRRHRRRPDDPRAGQGDAHELRQRVGRRVVEDHRARQFRARRRAQLVAQLDRHQRVEAERAELRVRVDRARIRVAEHRRDVLAHDVQHHRALLVLGQPGDPVGEIAGRDGPPRRADQPAQQRGRLVAERRQIQRRRDQRGHVEAQRRVEHREAVLGGDRQEALTGQPGAVGVGQLRRHPVVPHAPGQRHRRQPLTVPQPGQRVQVGIGGRVVGLAGRAERTGDRRVQHERLQITLTCQVVQVPGCGLGTQDRVQPLRGQRVDRAVVQDAGRVHDRGQVRKPVEQCLQRLSVRDVARHAAYVRHPRVASAAARQHDVAYTVTLHQMPCQQCAEGATGDQDRAVPRGGGAPARAAGEPRGQHRARADGHVRLVADDRGQVDTAVGVHQHDPAGVLGLGRPHQSLDRRGREVVAAPDHRHGPVARQLLLQRRQNPRRHVVDGAVRNVEHGVGNGHRGDRHPRPLVEAVGAGGELVRGHRTRRERRHGQYGRALGVDGVHRVGTEVHADPQRGGTGGVQPNALPGEGQSEPVGRRRQRVQRGVEQRGVHAEVVLLHRDLGEHGRRGAPGSGDVAEGGAVREPGRSQLRVHLGHVDRLRDGRPGQVGPRHGVVRQGAGGVEGPVAVGAGVDGHAVVDDLDLDLEGLGEHHRRFDDQLVQGGEPALPGRVEGEVDQCGAGHDRGAEHGVVVQPRTRSQPAGEQDGVAVRGPHHTAQQRVIGGRLPQVRRVGARHARREPVPLPLEGVRRQLDAVRVAVQRLRVGDPAVGVGGTQRGQRAGDLVLARPQRRREHTVGGLLGLCGEDAVGAEFDEGGDTVVLQFHHGVVEADGLTDLGDPVVGVGQVAVDGHGRDDGDPWCGVAEGTGHGAEVVEHRFHVVRVEGVADGECFGAASLGAEVLGDSFGGVGVAGDDDGGGAVDGGDAHAVGDVGGDFFFGGFDGGHGAGVGEGVHEGGAGGDEAGGVGEGEDAGDVGGGDLADGVADEVVGGDAPGLVEAVEGGFEGEECGLGEAGAVEVAGEELVLDAECGERGVQCLPEHRVGLVELAAHAGALRSLAGEQERQTAPARLALGQRRVPEERRPVRELGALGEGEPDVGG